MDKMDKHSSIVTPILIPYDPEEFWMSMRKIIREEIANARTTCNPTSVLEVSGMTHKPLFKMSEICAIFEISKPTVYDWIKHGKLKPYKIRSRVYFFWQDIQQLLQHPTETT